MVGYRFGILGPVACWDHDGAERMLTRRQQVVLGMLLIEAGADVAVDRLAETLWGEDLPTDPAAALRNHVARLRSRLGDDADLLATTPGGYRLSAPDELVDARVFENRVATAGEASGDARAALLGDALACWRGRALGPLADLPAFEVDARRLDELRDAARERRAESLLACGQAATAIPDLEALVAASPQREHARMLLMQALSGAGRHTEALSWYTSWRDELADRGLEPSPELRAAEVDALRHRGAPAAAPTATATSLPQPVSSFVGRDGDVAAVAERLGEARLVTLVGAGGVGKTRLAIEAAGQLADRYGGGVCFCDLSSARRPSDVIGSVASAVGLEEHGDDPLEVQIARQLGDRPVLLLLDCCERMLDDVAALAETLTRRTGATDILATSRERLAADGEHLCHVAPLRCGGHDPPAVELFARRARAAGITAIADPERETVARICERVDGLPLAIELAAARSRSMSFAELEAGLEQGFSLLDAGSRTTPRHRSLDALVAWSYDDLGMVPRTVFRRLCVFSGGFDLDAARAVAMTGDIGPDEAVDALLELVDRSLVTVTQGSSDTLYSLLDTLRYFGRARMAEERELEDISAVHARWVCDWVTAAVAGFGTADEGRWAARVNERLDDSRAALDWLTSHGDPAAGGIVAALHYFALWRGESEVFRWAERVLEAAPSTSEELAAVHAAAGTGAWLRGDLSGAERAGLAGLAATGGEADPLSRRPLEVLGDVALLRGDLDRAIRHYRSALGHALDCGDVFQAVWDQGSWALAHCYGDDGAAAAAAAAEALATAAASQSPSALAYAHFVLGEVHAADDPRAAEEHLHTARDLASRVASRHVVGLVDLSIASLYAAGDDPLRALRHYESVLQSWLHAGTWTAQWVTLRSLVALIASVGAHRDAAVLYGAVTKPARGPVPYGADARQLDAVATSLHESLGEATVAELAGAGRVLAEDQLGHEALRAVRSLITTLET